MRIEDYILGMPLQGVLHRDTCLPVPAGAVQGPGVLIPAVYVRAGVELRPGLREHGLNLVTMIEQFETPLPVPGIGRGGINGGLEGAEHPGGIVAVTEHRVGVARQREREWIFASVHGGVRPPMRAFAVMPGQRKPGEGKENSRIIGRHFEGVLQFSGGVGELSLRQRHFAKAQVVPGNLLGRCTRLMMHFLTGGHQNVTGMFRVAAKRRPPRHSRQHRWLGGTPIECREDRIRREVSTQLQVDLTE